MNLSVCKRLIKLESKYPMEIYDSQREKEIDEGEVVKGMVEMVFRSWEWMFAALLLKWAVI